MRSSTLNRDEPWCRRGWAEETLQRFQLNWEFKNEKELPRNWLRALISKLWHHFHCFSCFSCFSPGCLKNLLCSFKKQRKQNKNKTQKELMHYPQIPRDSYCSGYGGPRYWKFFQISPDKYNLHQGFRVTAYQIKIEQNNIFKSNFCTPLTYFWAGSIKLIIFRFWCLFVLVVRNCHQNRLAVLFSLLSLLSNWDLKLDLMSASRK